MKEWIKGLLERGRRLDGRGLNEYRQIDLNIGIVEKAEGSAWIRLGKTEVVVGVKLELGAPYPDSPNEGVLKVSAQLTPLAAPEFEASRLEDAVELARVVDRGIRSAHCIKLEELCLVEGERVWIVHVDIQPINHAGNLLDASALATLAALLNTRVPKSEDGKIIRGEYERALPVQWKPILITVCKVGNLFLLDPSLEEEAVVDTKLSICVRDDGCVCALQKQGKGTFTLVEVLNAIKLAGQKYKQLIKALSWS